MDGYYYPNQHRDRSGVSSQSSCDEDMTAVSGYTGSISYENRHEQAEFFTPNNYKRKARSSHSSTEDVVPAKRVYTSSTSYDNNLETSSQSEAETSQLSENTATDETASDSDSDSEVASAAPKDGSQSDDYGSIDGGRYSFAHSSMPTSIEDDLSYRTSSADRSANIIEGGGVAARLMAQMGYQSGTGLGKHAQGRVAPVEASKQKGRRGLGMAPTNFELDSDLGWREEEVEIKEHIEWMAPLPELIPDIDDLRAWMLVDQKKLTIENESEFVEPEVLTRILSCKSVFDNLEGEEMRKARTHSNPFELIRGVLFQNRAAMKMANLDSAFGYMFTSPKDSNGANMVKPGELLYFADICAGPGGFSEYVLWRRKWKCKGFGLTLKSGPGVNDFKLEEFFVSPSECFEPHYGVGGIDGDGDIYRQDNIDKFSEFVKENSQHKGVHFVMADGGFSVEGQENVQEILSKRLYLCQFLCAISVLRENGHFVCKLFDVFTPFSVGLIYLVRYCFEEVCLMKPVTSRPANSERYIVCKGYRSAPGDILRLYLSCINEEFDRLGFSSAQQKLCVQHIVPLSMLKADEDFFDYIYKSNSDLGHQQCLNLKKIQVYAKNPDLRDARQMDIRSQCLKLWQIPDTLRSAPDKTDPATKISLLLKGDSLTSLGSTAISDIEDLRKSIKSVHDYKVLVCGTQSLATPPALYYFLSMGRSMVFKWDGVSSASWKRVTDDDACRLQLDIPKDTLFAGEVVQELKGEGKGQKRIYALHVVDVLFLYGEDFRPYSYGARLAAAQTFVTAITKPSKTRLTPVRVKPLFKIEDLPSLLTNKLDYRIIKGFASEPKLCYTGDFHNHSSCCHVFAGLYFMPSICKPWTMSYSRSARRKYFYNTETKKSLFDCNEGFATAQYSLANRKLLVDKKVATRVGLGDLTVDLDDWIKSICPKT
ncbi:cap-specific mRNA (nucleoside-2'-O-)-methyltransferase 1-like [Watersipora subatra]|uniref:cap-specific mRNA (nucleoside-2'-O-)-methyltransferase 1-like n=1 Tax=Watersipora subatra TaxID=2589382 RepID=UPI00355B37A7